MRRQNNIRGKDLILVFREAFILAISKLLLVNHGEGH